MSYVGFFDILGFSEIIKNNTIDYIEYLLKGVIDIVDESSKDQYQYRLNFNIFSDTIAIWSEEEDFKGLNDIITSSLNLLRNGISNGIPLRGAISNGDIKFIQKEIKYNLKIQSMNLIYGDAIVKAHELEKNQNWSGCVIDPEITESLDITVKNIIKMNIDRKYIVEYDVPFKIDKRNKYAVINWANKKIPFNGFSSVKESFAQHNKTTDKEECEVKIKNTVEFYEKFNTQI